MSVNINVHPEQDMQRRMIPPSTRYTGERALLASVYITPEVSVLLGGYRRDDAIIYLRAWADNLRELATQIERQP